MGAVRLGENEKLHIVYDYGYETLNSSLNP
jgi:hypothetical protein